MENSSSTVDSGEINKRILKILLALVLFLCFTFFAVGYGSFSFLNFLAEESQSATATGQVVATHAAATSQVLATATGISYATEIASYEIYDDFDANWRNWETGVQNNEYWDGRIRIKDGLYIWDIREIKDPGCYSWRGFNQKITQDFDLSVDAKVATGSHELLCYGVAFRASPIDFNHGSYMFSVCEGGVFEVRYQNKVDGSETPIPWTRSSAIRSDGGNTISVSADGESVKLLINHAVVSEFTDQHLTSGYVYLFVRMFDDQPGVVHFDNFGFEPR
jgi:hypothetical protein